MSENTGGQGNKNLKYVFLLVGVAALLLSYFLVFTKYNTKISDIATEIDGLQIRYDDLSIKESNKQNIIDKTEEANSNVSSLLSRFDGGITYQSEIMDNYELAEKMQIDLASITLTPTTDVYSFGQLASSNPNGGVGGLSTDYIGVSTAYTITVTGSYEQMKDILKEIRNNTSKRKAITGVQFAYNTEDNSSAVVINVNEYAIKGEGREQSKVTMPTINTSTTNIFYNSIIKSE